MLTTRIYQTLKLQSFYIYIIISTLKGILQYDSEIYANGSNDTCGNDGYGKDGNSSSGSGRYQIPHQIATHGLNINRSPQHNMDRNGVHDSSHNYSTVSCVHSDLSLH